jgi:hypothetical protein
MQEFPAAKVFAEKVISCSVPLSQGHRIVDDFIHRLILRSASLSRALACQHFFKPEAVFFDALVYSRR